jgi:hypothetical protein
MTPLALALAQAERRLVARLETLATRLDGGDESAWPDYLATLNTLHTLVPAEYRPLVTTREMAERLGVKPRLLRTKGTKLGLQAIRLGARGTGAIRWRSA